MTGTSDPVAPGTYDVSATLLDANGGVLSMTGTMSLTVPTCGGLIDNLPAVLFDVAN
jgi:hypothetical protein